MIPLVIMALLKSMISVGHHVPQKGILISSGDAMQKADMLRACQRLVEKGYIIYATAGTYRYLLENDLPAVRALWPSEVEDGRWKGAAIPAALDLIRDGVVDLVVNIPKNFTHGELTNGYKMRRTAIDHNVPLITNCRLAKAYIKAFCLLGEDDLKIKSWDEY